MTQLDKKFTRINFQIKCPTVRVIQDGNPLGIMPIDSARKLAMDNGLDLVEVVPNANPPVCQVVDYEKHKYQQKQREKEQARKQKESALELKEIRLRPGIQEHDIETKVNSIRKFLAEGKKVQLNLQFKNREITHKEEGYKVVNKIVSSLEDVAGIERPARLEGFSLTCRLVPKMQNQKVC